MSSNFHLKVQDRGGILYDGPVFSITSYNEEGEFDVLPNHANFISLLQKKIVIRDSAKDPKEFNFESALMRVLADNVEVYIGVEGVFGTKV